MPLPNPQYYTIEDIYALPEGERAELIDGKMYMIAPPSYLHQTLCMELSATIRDYIRSHNGSCQVLPSPLAVNLQADDTTYVEPDISVVCDRSKINPKGISGAPDFIVEIVSPSSRKLDRGSASEADHHIPLRRRCRADDRSFRSAADCRHLQRSADHNRGIAEKLRIKNVPVLPNTRTAIFIFP